MTIATASSSAEPVSGGALPGRLRLTALLLWLGGGTIIAALGGALLLGVPGLASSWRRWIFRRLARGTARIIGLRITVVGDGPVAPFLLVSNHLSYLDIVTYAAVGPARFVAKQEVRGWPGLGLLARTLGTIFIDREQKRDAVRVIDRMTEALSDGDGVILFAESTSSGGSSVMPFRPALLDWAAREAFPVHAASVSYRVAPGAPAAAHSVCWWGAMEFAPHLAQLCRLGRIESTIRYGAGPVTDTDRKQLAARLHATVVHTFIPTGAGPA